MTKEEMGNFMSSYRADVAKLGDALVAPKSRDFITAVRETKALDDRTTELPVAAAVLALAEAHPTMSAAWRAEEPELFKRASWVLQRAKDDRPGQNDALMARWLILGKKEDAEAMAAAAFRGDVRGTTARWMLSHAVDSDADLAKIVKPILRKLPANLRDEMNGVKSS